MNVSDIILDFLVSQVVDDLQYGPFIRRHPPNGLFIGDRGYQGPEYLPVLLQVGDHGVDVHAVLQ